MNQFYKYLLTSALLLIILSIYIPIRYATPYPREIGPQFSRAIRTSYTDLLEQSRPDIFMLGDSMPGDDIDVQLADERLTPTFALVSLPGTASTIWYLIVKNNIMVAEHKPKYLVLFFRDSLMTVPSYRTTGRYFELVDEFAAPSDTLLIERAYLNALTPLEKFAEARLPFYGSRWKIRQSIDYYIRYFVGRLLLKCDTACMDKAMETVFAQDNFDSTLLSDAINTADDYLYTRQALDFDTQIGQSFLPEIVRMCRENSIQLILVRMPTLRFKDPGTKPVGLDRYLQKLSAYLKENNVAYLDFDQGTLPARYFRDVLHLNEQGRLVFTGELTEALNRIIK